MRYYKNSTLEISVRYKYIKTLTNKDENRRLIRANASNFTKADYTAAIAASFALATVCIHCRVSVSACSAIPCGSMQKPVVNISGKMIMSGYIIIPRLKRRGYKTPENKLIILLLDINSIIQNKKMKNQERFFIFSI